MNKNKTFIKKIEPYLWLTPAFLLFVVFVFYPFIKTLVNSFFIVDRFGNLHEYVGFDNFKYVLQDENFIKSIGNTIWFVILTVPISKVY